MVAESDGERRPAGLTVSEGRRGGGDPASAHQHLPDLERAARRSRATRPAKDDGAVSPQNDAPAAPDAVLVDPELRLDAAVFPLRLQLPGRAGRALTDFERAGLLGAERR